jgi:hypothetical protein
MVRSSIIAIKFIFILIALFNSKKVLALNLTDSFPITVSSSDEILKRYLRDVQYYFKSLKLNSDVRTLNTSLILEIDSKYFFDKNLLNCNWRRLILKPFSEGNDKSYTDKLIVEICGEVVGNISLTRIGANLKPLRNEDILTGNFPLPEVNQTWILKASWSEDVISVEKKEGLIHLQSKNSYSQSLDLTEIILDNYLSREYLINFATYRSDAFSSIKAVSELHGHDIFPSIKYYQDGDLVSAKKFIQFQSMTNYLFNSGYGALFRIPKLNL